MSFLLLAVCLILCQSFILHIFPPMQTHTHTLIVSVPCCGPSLMFHLCNSPADNKNHTKGDSPKTSSASGPQEPLWRGAQAHSSVKLQIQPQSISQRNHTLSRKCCHQLHSPHTVESVVLEQQQRTAID